MDLAQKEEAGTLASSLASVAARLEGWLGRMVEVPVALLTALEVLILLAGVISRYVFRNPLVWSDELASILFLWLAMLGAVVAFHRGEHMRMSTLVARAPPRWRAFFEAFAAAVAIAFLALILHSSIEYAIDEAAIVTPAMEIPNIWRASAIPIGCALMLIFALLRLARVGGLGQIILALLVIAAIGAGLWVLKPLFIAMGNYKLVVFFVLLVAAGVLAGAPIAFVFAMATFAFLAITTRTPLTVVVSRMDEGMSHIILLSVPLFVFLGLLIEATGMARAMVDFLASLLGHVRGGLSYVLLGAIGFSRDLATAMTGLPGGAVTFMIVSIIVFVILGSVLEGIPAIVLFGPLLFPIARQIGIHKVHYSIVVILAMGINPAISSFIFL
jgi:TRAP-type C4-dicarboxylate transport system permease small subunit